MKYFKTNFLFIFLLLFFTSCQENNKQRQTQTMNIQVGYIKALKEDLSINIDLSGRVKAKEVAQIRPQISGIIEKSFFKEGSFVEKGDILYKIDDSIYKAKYEQALANYKSSKASFLNFEKKNKRAKELLNFNGISNQDYEDLNSEYLKSQALLEQKEAELNLAKIELQRCEIKAPISGYIGISNFTKGALVNANQAEELSTIKNSSFVFVDLNISYNELLELKSFSDFEENLKVNLSLDNGYIYPKKGILQTKELDIDENSGNITLRALFENDENLLLPGMFVKASLESSKKFSAFLLPQQAVLRDQKANPIVTIINNDNTVEQKKIKIKRASKNKWIVLEGIKEEDKIIVEGLNKIHPKTVVVAQDLSQKYRD